MTNSGSFFGERCLIIAEVGIGHDGSLGLAHAYIDAIAQIGADGVKFQTHIASAESTFAEPFRVDFSYQDATRYQYWNRIEFTEIQWKGLADHAREKELLFLSSPFSIEAVELLIRIGTPMWKIASGEVSNKPMLDRITETRQPILLSSGMSGLDEMDQVIKNLQGKNVPLAVLQCTTSYPCPPEKIGLNMLKVIRDRYECAVGLSDHSGTIYPGLAAATLGADVIEAHVIMSRQMFGPDVSASLTTAEFGQLVQGIRFIERMLAHPVNKNELAAEANELRAIFTRSLVARTALESGTLITSEHLVAKKPGTGIPAERMPEIIGRKLRRRVDADALLSEDDLEGVKKVET